MLKKVYICNAFSLQMLENLHCNISICEVKELPTGLTSAIGHQDTANVLGYFCNRVNVKLHDGDVLYVAQLTGGRLPEGATTLPKGFSFKYLRVEVKED